MDRGDVGSQALQEEALVKRLDSADTLQVQGLIVSAPHQVALQTFDLDIPQSDYVQIRVEACGLCTWEQRVYRGVKPGYPFWGGHEVCGVVDAVGGANINGLQRGDRVAVALMRRCGQCEFCRRGLDNHCVYVRPEPPGPLPAGPRGLSSVLLVPPYQVFRLAPGLTPGEGALVEPLACVLRSITQAALAPGDIAVVLGAGTMGLIHTVLARMAGCRVLVCADEAAHVEHAHAAGAELVLPMDAVELEAHLRQMSGGRGADAVFCTRGGAPAVALAVRVAARGGRVLLYQSIRDGDSVTLSANDLHYREIKLLGSISQTAADFRQAADLLSANPGLLRCLVRELVPAEQGQAAFARALDPAVHRVMVSFL